MVITPKVARVSVASIEGHESPPRDEPPGSTGHLQARYGLSLSQARTITKLDASAKCGPVDL